MYIFAITVHCQQWIDDLLMETHEYYNTGAGKELKNQRYLPTETGQVCFPILFLFITI